MSTYQVQVVTPQEWLELLKDSDVASGGRLDVLPGELGYNTRTHVRYVLPEYFPAEPSYTELSRHYRFAQDGFVYEEAIDEPINVRIMDDGSHQVTDSQGKIHEVPSGWIRLIRTQKIGVTAQQIS